MSAPSAINNAKGIIIGATPATNTITTTDLNSAAFQAATNVGEIGIFTQSGVRVTQATAVLADSDRFVIAVSRGAALPPIVSDVIVKSSMTNVLVQAFAAAAEQSTGIGYNGTTGDLSDAVANHLGELMAININLQQFWSGTDAEKLKAGYYQSLLTDDEIDIANGLVKSINDNFKREVKNAAGNPPIVAELLSAAATVATAGTVTISQGSTQVGLSVAGDVAANGDVIRLGNTTSDNCYVVVSGAGTTTVTLDRPINEASAVIAIAAADSLTNAALLAAAAGVRIDGQVLDFTLGKSRYTKVRFVALPNPSMGTAPVSVVTAVDAGSGTVEQVAQLENFLNGYSGEQYRMGQPFLFDSTDNVLASAAVTGGGYWLLSFSHSDTITQFQNEVSKKEIVLAVPTTTPNFALSAAADDITDILEDMVGFTNNELSMG